MTKAMKGKPERTAYKTCNAMAFIQLLKLSSKFSVYDYFKTTFGKLTQC